MASKKDSAVSPASAKPVDLTAHKPSAKGDGADTSTSTGGATATRNTGAESAPKKKAKALSKSISGLSAPGKKVQAGQK